MTEMKARLVDKDGNPLGTAANPLKISDHSISTATWGSITGTLSDQTDLNTSLTAKASSTSAALSILIYDGTPSAGDLTTYDEIYTTPALCFAALPAIINHAVTIKMRKADGSAYAAATLQRVVAGGSITIKGEYYWYGTNASSKTGKFDLGSSDFGYADRAQIAAGDVVWATKWSGTVNASTPSESIIDTVASVSGTEITLTTNSGKAFDTTWTYRIVKTQISGPITASCNVAINGISCDGTGGSSGIAVGAPGTSVTISYCHITGTQPKGVYSSAKTTLTNCVIRLTGGTGNCIHVEGAIFKYDKCVISGPVGVRTSGSFSIFNTYNHILSGTGTGIWLDGNSFVRSYAGLNEATTPMNPASSSDGAYILQG